jgi:predicted ATPase/DNA-binding CsgD family transcriptional regulator
VSFPPPTAEAFPKHLPLALSSFVGRQHELAELREAIAAARLLTLTGPGGCGKTRLAVELASRVADRFPDGVWWVDLAPLAEERLVPATVAEVLEVRPLPGSTELQALCTYLASRQALIVLDNCEHLLRACAEVGEALLQAGPDAVVLATSRAPLGIGGETEWRVPSLSLPGSVNGEPEVFLAGSGGADRGSDAVALFMERALAARPDLVPSADDADHVAAICTELDGLPLAIELAAARVRILSVAQIAAGLSDRFRMLSGGPNTVAPRLKAMRASVEWSHELLSVAERALLRRLAVFAGGFTLEAVDEVCAGDGIEHEAMLDLLASLVDQSLILAEERELGVRYRLLETVRQYGLEQLVGAGEEQTLRALHRDHFLALAETSVPNLETDRQREMVELLNSEAANLAAALDASLGSEPALALRFCAALQPWWAASARFAEAELAYPRALDACTDGEPELRARVFQSRANTAIATADYEAAEAYATEALALTEDNGIAARARCCVGWVRQEANPREGRSELTRAAELARAAGDDWALVWARQLIALSYFFQSDHEQCTRANDEVADLAERLGDPFQVGRRWLCVGLMAGTDGRFADAREASAQIWAVVEGLGDPIMETFAVMGVAFSDVWHGESERALGDLQRQLDRALKLGAGLAVLLLLLSIASAELAVGRTEQARDRLEGLVLLVEGRVAFLHANALCLLAEARRLLGADGAEPTAIEARAIAERIDNRLFATRARLTLGRLAAAHGEWTAARDHALAHLDACVEGGHLTYLPDCLDCLAEIAAGLQAHDDAVRLFAVADRARAEIGSVRVRPEESHWAAIDVRLREALGLDAYEAARREGAGLTIDDALEWARRARGRRRRPPGGWDSLTPTELRVVELVAEGLTNPQIGERMFVSKATVKTHLAHIFKKLDVRNRAELSAHAAHRNTGS